MKSDIHKRKSGVLQYIPDLEQLYSILSVPVIVHDLDGHIASINEAMARLMDVPEDEFKGMECHHALRQMGVPFYSCPLMDNSSSKSEPASCRLYISKVHAYFLVTRYPILNEDKRPVGGMCVFNELSSDFSISPGAGSSLPYLEYLADAESDCLCWKDGEGRWQFVNKATRQLLHLKHDDYVGKTDFEIAASNMHFRAFFAKCAALDEEAWKSGKAASTRITIELNNHRSSTFEVIRVPFYNRDGSRKGMAGIARDISRQIISEQELHSAINQLNVILNNISSGILLVIDRKIIWTNPACEKLLGYFPGEIQGHSLEIVFRSLEEYQEFGGRIFSELSRRGYSRGEVRLRNKDGEYVWCVYSAAFVNSEEPQDGIILALEDIQAQKDAWKREQELQEKMLHSQKLESLGVLAGGIAHDFNNLLMGIMGNMELCLMKLEPDSPLKKYIQRVRSASQKAAELTAQMLAYSGCGHFVVEPVNISRVVREMCELLESVISKKARLVLELDDNLPDIMGDVSQMRQVVMNLIVNASEALEDRPGDIFVRSGVMEVDLAYLNKVYFDHDAMPGPYVWFEVEDTGAGMDNKTIARMFEPFFTTKFSGRGLGLAALLGIVRGHNGIIRVDSDVGRGTVVRVLFPASNDMQKRLLQGSARKGEGRQGALDIGVDSELTSSFKGRRILLVDDEADVRDVMRQLLESFGFKVTIAINGGEAIKVFEDNPEQFTAVILDITMPDMSGVEVLQVLRQIYPQACIVLSSGYSEDKYKEKIGRDADGFLKKPCTALELEATLLKAIKESIR